MATNALLIFFAGILSPIIPIPLTFVGIILALNIEHHYLTVVYLYVYVLFVDIVSFSYNYIYINFHLHSYLTNNIIWRAISIKLSRKTTNSIGLLSQEFYKNNIIIKMVLARLLLPFTLFYTFFVLYRKKINYLHIIISSIVGLTPRILIISGLINLTIEFATTSSMNYVLSIIVVIIMISLYLIKKILINK